MAIKDFRIIGESLNASVAKTAQLLEAWNLPGLVAVAKSQEEQGAAFIDVNIGQRKPVQMAELVKCLQEHVSVPLALDSPDIGTLRAGLEAYDPRKAGGRKPLINSIAETRREIFDLYAVQPFKTILIASEREEDGKPQPNRTGETVRETTRRLVRQARKSWGMPDDDLLIDPGIAPIGADSEGITKTALDGMRLIKGDSELRGVHLSVGLSNFSAMLPARKNDGTPIRLALENAFLTLAVPLGLDYIIGSLAKDYRLLAPTDSAYQAVVEAVERGGFETIIRIRQFYRGDAGPLS
jgi:cobalamin-dependent methionine synthase I